MSKRRVRPLLRTTLWLTLGLAVIGCAPDDPTSLTVATTYSRIEREQIEKAFPSARIRWILLAPGDDISHLAKRRGGPDVLLGGPISSYAQLAREGALAGESPSFRMRHRVGSLTLGERTPERWLAGYALLVRQWDAPGNDVKAEGVAVLRQARHAKLAHEFVEAVGTPIGSLTNPDADSLMADLLHATLVNAHDERLEALSILEKTKHPERAERWMSAPPPWPPASVELLLNQESNAMAMMETLAGQLAPDPKVRSWLVRSWLAPGQLVDDTLLNEIATAVDGKLVREPRFRAWLRSEWTAWARQRYRRVARLANQQETSS